MQIHELTALARNNKASDIHISEGLPLMFRIDGHLAEAPVQLSAAETRSLILSLMDEAHREAITSERIDADFALVAPDGTRSRVNVFYQQGRAAATLRLLNDSIPTLEELAMPPVLTKLADEPRGLILVTGPTGSGKSTTLAAMIDHINKTRSDHIITIEDPIEYVYQGRCSLIHQREVGADVRSFASALRSALREDPDVILVGEMRDYETISAAVTAAETGHLVMSTLHTIGAAQTIDRIIDVCPAGAQNQIRGQLAAVLRGVITQQLLPLAVGKGRCAATEILVGTDAVANLIREGKCYQIPSILQSGAALGMHSLNADLARLVSTGRITRRALRHEQERPEKLPVSKIKKGYLPFMRQIPFFFTDSQVHVVSLPPLGEGARGPARGRMRGSLSGTVRKWVIAETSSLIRPCGATFPHLGEGKGLSHRCPHQPAAAAMAVGNRHAEGVGGIVGLGDGLEVQHYAGHLLNLLLHGLAVAGDGLLDLHGCVFVDRHAALRRGQQNDAAGLGHANDGGLVVLVVQLFDGEGLGLVTLADVEYALINFNEALFKGRVLLGDDRPVADGCKAVADVLHNTPAHNGIPRVDAQNAHSPIPPHFNRYSIP